MTPVSRGRIEPSTEQEVRQEVPCRWKSLLAEATGTFFLTFAAAGAVVFGAVTGQVEHVEKVMAPGMVVMALIYAMGNISGAHFNPAVTFAFALRRSIRWAAVPGYWIAQFLGAILAAQVLLLMYGNVHHLGATSPIGGVPQAFGLEIILTMLLILVILGTAKNHQIVGNNAAIAVGFTIALDGFVGESISGASMNPARSLGPALLSGDLSMVWIYLLAPVLGTIFAVVITTLLQGFADEEEEQVAAGEQGTASAA